MIEDISGELARYITEASYDEGQLDEVISRLDLLNRLYLKYGGDYHKTKQYYREVCDRIFQIEKEKICSENQLKEELEERLLQYAKALQEERRKVAIFLEKRMIEELSTSI